MCSDSYIMDPIIRPTQINGYIKMRQPIAWLSRSERERFEFELGRVNEMSHLQHAVELGREHDVALCLQLP